MTVTTTPRIARGSFVSFAFVALALALASCSSTTSSTRGDASTPVIATPSAGERQVVVPPGTMLLEALEGPRDTVEFHIGSPLFLRLQLGDERACPPGVGEFFHFDATGAQLGWSFEEVVDSLLFPPTSGQCERILMLSSEASNRLADGRFTMRTELFIDPKDRVGSNLIALRPVRSKSGADEESYARFLQEQIVRNAAHLRDPQTLAALFGEGVPTSAESEVYRAVVLYRSGDLAGAAVALQTSAAFERERRRAMTPMAARTRAALERRLAIAMPHR